MARAANGFPRRQCRIRAPAKAGTTMTMTMTMRATITIGTTTDLAAHPASVSERLAKNDGVLPRQVARGRHPHERVHRSFLAHLRFAHGVQSLDRHGRVAGPELDEHQPPAGLERAHDGSEHLVGIFELVIDIHHQREVDAGGRQPRIGQRAEQRFHVGGAAPRHLLLEELDHLGLYVYRVYRPARAHSLRHAPRVVTGARADVGDRHAGLELERGEQEFRPFLLHALWALQPLRAVEAHDPRNFAAQVDFADAIGARLNGGVATWRGLSPPRRPGERKYQEKKQGELRIHFPSPGSRTTIPLAKISTATAASSNPMIRITTLMPIFPSRRPIWVAALSAIQVVSATSRQQMTTAAKWASAGRCAA